MTKPMGAVNKNTIKQLRTRYAAIWNIEWPHEDEYLKTLWRRAIAEVKMDHAGFDKERYDVTLNAMRENHVFPGEELVTTDFKVPFADFDYEVALPKYKLTGECYGGQVLRVHGCKADVDKFEIDFDGIARLPDLDVECTRLATLN